MQKNLGKLTFFRQSGWMLVATVVGGAFMWAVHPLITKPVDQVNLGWITELLKKFIQPPISADEYGLVTALIQIINLMAVPAIGLQTVFAQQAAATLNEAQERQLRGAMRGVLGVCFVIWLVVLFIGILFEDSLIRNLNISEPASLWLTAFASLPILWQPVFLGVLQGRQNFLWMGWASILGGVGRCLAVLVMVRLLGAHVSGAMTGLLAGSVVALGLCLWPTWPTLCGPADPFDWRGWLRRLVPLTLGLGASILMMGLDMIVVRRFFPASATGFYGAAGTLGRALVFFTVPMAAVMFPKVVQAAARGERSNVLAQALGVTALMGALAALGCTLFPALPLRLVWDESYLAVEPLVPWFAWCMLPLPLSNVLVNHLLAQQRYKAIPWLMLVIVCYGLTLVICCSKLAHTEPLGAFRTVVQILGGFGLLLLCVAAWFTWGVKHNSNSGTDSLGSRERKSHPDVVPG